jgi:dihydroxyacetone kinase-like predicted kinase
MKADEILQALRMQMAMINDLLRIAHDEQGLQLHVHVLKPEKWSSEYDNGHYDAIRLTQIIDIA